MKSSRWACALVFVWLLSSCASTDVTQTWKNANYTLPIQKILVIGLADSPGRRGVFEDTLSASFIREGKQAVPSSNYFEDISVLNEETISTIVKKNKINAVIVARIVLVDKEQRFLASTYPAHYNSFYSYYGRYLRTGENYYDPGYSLKETLVSLEINLYETTNARLIWAITTETFFSENINQEINKIAKIIMHNLKKEKLL